MWMLAALGAGVAARLPGAMAAALTGAPAAAATVATGSTPLAGSTVTVSAVPSKAEDDQSQPVREVMRFGLKVNAAAAGRAMATGPEKNAIGSELYLTAEAIGVPESMVDEIVRIFSGRLDFHRDLENGFDCSVLYQMRFDEGMIGKPGNILAVRLVTPASSIAAYLFQEAPATPLQNKRASARQSSLAVPEEAVKAVVFGPDVGQVRGAAALARLSLADYYDATGHSLGRRFLQSPIQFTRITSGYAVRRFHPILKLWRAHTGTDFAAPIGTPVRVTADGVVRFEGVQGGYGNLVIVDHGDGLSSRYGHLSAFAPGLRPGSVVHQGDLLARVGMTGMATGPHLHYEMRRADVPFDPAMLDASPTGQGSRLSAARLSRFEQERTVYDRQLELPQRTNLVER